MWLAVGGAGYIGSHLVNYWQRNRVQVCVLDNLSTGSQERIPEGVPFVQGDAKDPDTVTSVIADFHVNGIVHFAAKKHARESMTQPLEYWRENIVTLLSVLHAATCTGIRHVILSSSCSVYGEVSRPPVEASSPTAPVSPYGKSKLAAEEVLFDWAHATGAAVSALRYFNVIGNGDFLGAADNSTECLIPSVTRAIFDGKPPQIMGADFNTRDGTAERDYLDVRDLSYAHALVAQDLKRGKQAVSAGKCLNVSRGQPASVKSIVEVIADETGWKGPISFTSRHPGDPESVWAAPSPELLQLGWFAGYAIPDSIRSHVRGSAFWNL